MKCITADLGRELHTLEILPFADAHIGDPRCDMALVRKYIEYVETTENARMILNGDLINNALRNSVSDVYADAPPMEQIANVCKLFEPVKDKILGATGGNHEGRTYKDAGIDVTRIMLSQLGLGERYSDGSLLLFVKFGATSDGRRETNGSGNRREICYSIYANHGSGGGRKEGAKAIRLADMASIIDCDVYIHSHTHLPFIMKNSFHRIDYRNYTCRLVDKLFVNTAACLDYGGYAELQEYKPSSKAMPRIVLSDGVREMTGIL